MSLPLPSAPGGKEVERKLHGGAEAEAEHSSDTPLNPCFDWECSCVCHIHMPGMKLVWVPIDEEEEEDEKEEEVKLDAETEEEESGGEGTSLAIKHPPPPLNKPNLSQAILKFPWRRRRSLYMKLL